MNAGENKPTGLVKDMDTSILNTLSLIAPDLMEEMELRALILERVAALEPIGRRALAARLHLAEREVRAAAEALKKAGFSKVVMMTGDSERTARAVAAKVGVDEYYSEVLPEDKASFVEKEKAKGRKVVMLGDGINDSPALSAADAGIAVSEGAEIAREIADITIGADNLEGIVVLKHISDALMKRIHNNYRTIVGFNTGLILLGVAGILQPTTSALLHNTSTLLIGMNSMKNLVGTEEI